MKTLALPSITLLFLTACVPAQAPAIAMSTATLAASPFIPPTFTPPPSLTATASPTPTSIATAQPTLTENQVLIARLAKLPGYTWAETTGDAGEQVILLDGKNNVVASLDRKTQGVRWDSLKYFDQLNLLLTTPEGQKTLGTFLEKNKNDIHFVTYPAAPDNGKTPPPSVVILTPDTNQVRVVQGMHGTKDFRYNAQSKRLLGISVYYKNNGYYDVDEASSYYNPTLNRFVYDEVLLQKLMDEVPIDFDEPERVQTVKEALKLFQTYDPTVITAEDIVHATTIGNTNFQIYYDGRFGQGAFYETMNKFRNGESNLANFYHNITKIMHTKKIPSVSFPCVQTCWRAIRSGPTYIGIDDDYFTILDRNRFYSQFLFQIMNIILKEHTSGAVYAYSAQGDAKKSSDAAELFGFALQTAFFDIYSDFPHAENLKEFWRDYAFGKPVFVKK